ncbi:hypothetical protein KW787_00955 [Candidatus Pacearchaeota archaeon]|nr:hypothetical protein [Candidatus Pacearchaeota archaeon]
MLLPNDSPSLQAAREHQRTFSVAFPSRWIDEDLGTPVSVSRQRYVIQSQKIKIVLIKDKHTDGKYDAGIIDTDFSDTSYTLYTLRGNQAFYSRHLYQDLQALIVGDHSISFEKEIVFQNLPAFLSK